MRLMRAGFGPLTLARASAPTPVGPEAFRLSSAPHQRARRAPHTRSKYFLWLPRDGNDNGGGGGSKENGGQSIADRLVAGYRGAEAALARLAEENYEYREEKRSTMLSHF
jgi:hypothetical protein